MGIQEKVMNEIKKTVEEQGFEFVNSRQFTNCGVVRIMDGFKTILGFGYNFQSSWQNCSLQFYPGDKEIVRTCGFVDKNCIGNYYIQYKDLNTEMPRMLNFVSNYLLRHKEAV